MKISAKPHSHWKKQSHAPPGKATPACDSFHARGVSAAAGGNTELAASLFVQAIQLGGPRVEYCFSLAKVLQACGNYGAAAACYRQAIAGAPGNIPLHLSLARVLLQDQRLADAIAVLKLTLTAQPDVAEAWALLGGALSLAGQTLTAMEALQQAVALDPEQAGFHYDLGVVLGQLGDLKQAEAAYRRALQVKGHFPEALNNLGNLLRRRNAAAEAVICFRRALRYRPGHKDATYNLGLALQDLNLLEDAGTCYEAVLAMDSTHHAASNNYANVLAGQDKIDGALFHYERALQFAPDNREYRVNIGMAQLLNGEFSLGWQNYAARVAPAVPDRPLWHGESIEGQSILVLAEQGLGDTLQFIRYSRLLQAQGGVVRAVCQAPLVELLRSTPGLTSVTATGDPAPACDWYAPLLHLPGFFGTTVDSIPAETPYLLAGSERVRQWGELLKIPESHLKVGIAWRGAAEHWNDRNRSLDPEHLAHLAGVPDTAFVSLQKGYREGSGPLPFVRLPRELTDFADTAALMAHLDLVISVDTSVTHLAGALARPVWTLLPYAPDWRWLRSRTDSPWYPGMKLFRQERRGDWRGVLERVREELMQIQKPKQ